MIVLALFVACLWGVSPVVNKHVLKTVDVKLVMVVSGLAYFLCLIAFTAYNSDTIRKSCTSLTPTSIAWIVFTSVATGFLANLLYLFVLKNHESYVISALIYSSPVFTLLLAHFILKEDITTTELIGVALIVTGIICLAFNGSGK